jgi:hypothetical protein
LSTNNDHAREIRYALTDARGLCERLGLLAKGQWKPQPRGAIVRCPWHDDRSPSCSVRIGKDGTIAVKCHACGQGADALALVAQVHGLSTKSNFRQVLAIAAELADRHDLADAVRGDAPRTYVAPSVRPPAEPDRTYPPIDEVLALWNRCKLVSDDPESSDWCRSRGLDPDAVDGSRTVRALSKNARLATWAAFGGVSWRDTGHRLIFAMRDASGAIRSLRAGRVIDGDSPKRLPPGGYKASGLVMACDLALGMLAGTWRPKQVVILEGEPDFLAWASRRNIAPIARIGIVSGSWTEGLAMKFPTPADGPPCQINVLTDKDAAGNRYGLEVAESLRRRGCLVSWTERPVI